MQSRPQYVAYVSCLSGTRIEVFTFSDDPKRLNHCQSISLSGKGLPLAPSPDVRQLYASVIGEKNGQEEDRIDVFAIDRATGRLTAISSRVILARMAHIRTDRTGRYLLGASFASSLIATWSISEDGQLSSEPGFTMPTPSKAHQILTDRSNSFAFIPNLGADLVMQLKFDVHTGTFCENTPSVMSFQAGAGCRHIAHHPNGRFLYLLNERDGSLIVLHLDTRSGRLTEVMRDVILRPDMAGVPWGAQIHVAPDGQRLYATERRGATLAQWNIDNATGHVSNRILVETGQNPRCFDITPDGKFLLLGAMAENRVELYTITGEQPQKIAELPTAEEPGWVEIVDFQE